MRDVEMLSYISSYILKRLKVKVFSQGCNEIASWSCNKVVAKAYSPLKFK